MTEVVMLPQIWTDIKRHNPYASPRRVAFALARIQFIHIFMPWLTRQCRLRAACMFVHTIRNRAIDEDDFMVDLAQCVNLQYKCTDALERPLDWKHDGTLNRSGCVATAATGKQPPEDKQSSDDWDALVTRVAAREVALLKMWNWDVYVGCNGLYEWADENGKCFETADRVVDAFLLPSAKQAEQLHLTPDSADVRWAVQMVHRLALDVSDQFELHTQLQSKNESCKRKVVDDDGFIVPAAKRPRVK